MRGGAVIDCEAFDGHADELAIGHVDEPLRGRLLAHASSCEKCHGLLDGLGAVADRLLLLAPEVEPPPGFEVRALSRMSSSVPPAPMIVRAARRPVPGWLAVAAALALVLVGVGIVTLTGIGDTNREAGRGTIISIDGDAIGTVRLVRGPAPHVLVQIDSPRPEPGLRHCELLAADGTWVEVGTWDVADIAQGLWAVGVEPDLLDSTSMRITADDGTVLASAEVR